MVRSPAIRSVNHVRARAGRIVGESLAGVRQLGCAGDGLRL
jgi:hypothetical protein